MSQNRYQQQEQEQEQEQRKPSKTLELYNLYCIFIWLIASFFL